MMKLDQQDARMDTPLLEDVLENQNSSQGASISGAVFNITTTMIGAGIMSIPAAIKVLGIVPGFLLILVVAFFTEVTVEFLLRYTKSGKSTTYAGIVGESFGAIGSVAVQICVIITIFGALIIYLIIIGDVLCGSKSGETLHLGILQEWFGIHWWNSRAFAILFIVLFVMLPLVWQKRVDSLKYTSAISILLAVLFVVICSAMAIQALWEGKSTQKLRLLPDFSKVSVFDLFTTVPIFVTGFGFHVNVHPIRVELGKPTEMSLAVRISLAITVAIYSAIGFFGYLLFGDSIMSDMLVNFDQNSDTTIGKLLDVIVRLTYAIHLLLVFPLLNFTLRANIDELLFPKKPILASDTLRFVSLTCVLLAITYIIAIAIPDIWLFFQFMGSTTVVCLSFIFPGAIILRDVHGISTTRDKIIAILVILLAVGTSTIAISTSLYG
ncbi:amino acid transporter AVT6C [Quercus suber]|uniref:Amino acid transporter avt6c n=1 Tax=Quercus suber TaxID=58331 RepID=A0AAW0IDQ9_QUESU|nr:amino acid transporter AVT6C-like [Quercus suber]POE55479.1 putative sodium-coupled neutral amino acid transporter 7 [Quercus suber]